MRLGGWWRHARAVYAALSCRQRVHFWCTLGFWALGGIGLLASANPQNPLKGGELVTFSNLVSLAGALIAAGTVWQQWQDAKAKLAELTAAQKLIEQTIRTLQDEHLPETYVRRDVFEERMRALGGGPAPHGRGR